MDASDLQQWIKQCLGENNSADQTSAIIEAAWCDKTSFASMSRDFGLSEPQVKALMRQKLKPSSYRLWRRRVYGRAKKHAPFCGKQ